MIDIAAEDLIFDVAQMAANPVGNNEVGLLFESREVFFQDIPFEGFSFEGRLKDDGLHPFGIEAS